MVFRANCKDIAAMAMDGRSRCHGKIIDRCCWTTMKAGREGGECGRAICDASVRLG